MGKSDRLLKSSVSYTKYFIQVLIMQYGLTLAASPRAHPSSFLVDNMSKCSYFKD